MSLGYVKPTKKYSLEQIRFLNRINNASRRMNDIYKIQSQKVHLLEKEKYAKKLEDLELQSIGENVREGPPRRE